MFTQFFGNYLLTQGAVTQEQLFSAMKKLAGTRMRLGTLAIHAGYMTASEVDKILIEQTHTDKKFGEIAVEQGYLTDEQVAELLSAQSPDFLLLGQILVDDGVISNSDFEHYISDYRAQNEMLDLDLTKDNHDIVSKLLKKFFVASEIPPTRFGVMYIELLFNNFVRFLGEDFTILTCSEIKAYPVERCIKQSVLGDYSISAYLSMDDSTAAQFASRYVGDEFLEFDEYVQASMEDFLNLHNGLFIVNVSNESSMDLSISTPEVVEELILDFENRSYHFPILYSFGTVNFILEVVKLPENI